MLRSFIVAAMSFATTALLIFATTATGPGIIA